MKKKKGKSDNEFYSVNFTAGRNNFIPTDLCPSKVKNKSLITIGLTFFLPALIFYIKELILDFVVA